MRNTLTPYFQGCSPTDGFRAVNARLYARILLVNTEDGQRPLESMEEQPITSASCREPWQKSTRWNERTTTAVIETFKAQCTKIRALV